MRETETKPTPHATKEFIPLNFLFVLPISEKPTTDAHVNVEINSDTKIHSDGTCLLCILYFDSFNVHYFVNLKFFYYCNISSLPKTNTHIILLAPHPFFFN